MELHELILSIIQSKDLLYTGQQLIEFADAAYKEKNRTALIKYFYENLYQWVSSYIFDDLLKEPKKNYFICEDSEVVRFFVALRLPPRKTTVKSIREIRAFGEFILAYYTQPVGKCISRSSLNNILNYLDERFSFSSKIFPNGKTFFLRMPYSHREYNSECLTAISKGNIVSHFFLYHMKEKGRGSPNPEAVLFHELGHAIHAYCFGDVTKVPDDVIDILQKMGFPDLKQVEASIQSEVFADVLSVGLMYQTPYEKYDIYKTVHQSDKMAFKVLVETLLQKVPGPVSSPL